MRKKKKKVKKKEKTEKKREYSISLADDTSDVQNGIKIDL